MAIPAALHTRITFSNRTDNSSAEMSADVKAYRFPPHLQTLIHISLTSRRISRSGRLMRNVHPLRARQAKAVDAEKRPLKEEMEKTAIKIFLTELEKRVVLKIIF
ncbi:hypothetical protein TcasGA2_TC008945 [Tribolium castaneum]|uniref:Uncharacterized protein n=1 Tax=Tribolium castaneum TaxID=7070 RepID=D6WQA8_TRICA|nr:hypothetical protein TcasGA2_TC008945 [Tribolium castaneum]